MQITMSPIFPNNPFFKARHPIKKAFDKGLMPDVKKGLLGHKLTKKNRSVEHIIPKSKGGTLANDNVALSDRMANMQRGNRPIEEFVTHQMWIDYLRQFIKVKNQFIDGMEYIKGLCKKFKIDIKEVLNV